MKHPVKISVIIPIYNVANYLPFALQSCIDQTLKDVEFICVNDGSTDESLEILERYAALDSRIKIINKENGGLSSARNAGMKKAIGKYVMFLDSDDFLATNACERVWIETEEGRTDIVVFGTEIIPANPAPSEWYNNTLHVPSVRYYNFDRNILFYERGSMPFVWRQAFAKSLLDKAGVLFDEDVKFGEDTVFQMEIFPYAENISYISDRLYVYRWRREGSLMAKMDVDEKQKLMEHYNIVEKIFTFWAEHDIFSKYEEYALAWFIDFAGWPTLQLDKKQNGEAIDKFVEMVDKYELGGYCKKLDDRQQVLYKTLYQKPKKKK